MSQRRHKSSEPRRLPGSWIKIPVTAIQELTPSEYALWSALQALCIANDHCWPTVETIGNYLSLRYTQTWSLLQSLKAKGWLTTEKRGRQVNYSPVTPSGPLQKTEEIVSESIRKTEEINPGPLQNSEEIAPDHFGKLKTTSSENRRATLRKTEDRISKKESVRKNQDVLPSSTVETPKRVTRKKAPIIRDPEKLRVLLDSLNFALIQQEFPTIDVPARFAEFRDITLNGTEKDDRANPYGYVNFLKAFRNWCKRDAVKAGPVQAQKPKPQPQDLSKIEY